jgi:serine/threonine protein kinase
MVESSSKLTSSGTVLGTPAYMSPEQGTGSVIDHRSDIYSLGIILYEAVTGRVPYNAETPIAIVFKHIQDPLPSARKLNPELPESVELILLKALAKKPEDRYQNMEAFLQAIQMAFSDTSPMEATSPQKNRGEPTAQVKMKIKQEAKETALQKIPKQKEKAGMDVSNQAIVLSARRRRLLRRVVITVVILGGLLFGINAAISLAKSRGALVTELPVVTTSSRINNLRTSTNANATETTTIFSKGQDVYVRFGLNKVQAGTTFETKWYYRINIFGKRAYFLFTSLVYNTKADDFNVHFFLNKPDTQGDYQVDIYMNGTLVGRQVFSVQ